MAGDYAPKELGKAMDKAEHHDAIARRQRCTQKGRYAYLCGIGESVARNRKADSGAVVVTGETKNRSEIIACFLPAEKFRAL